MIQFLASLLPGRTPFSIDNNEDMAVLRERILRERILQSILLGILAVGLPVVINSVIQAINRGAYGPAITYTVIYLIVGVLTVSRNFNYSIRAYVLLLAFYAIALSDLIQAGMSGEGRITLLGFIVLSGILINVRTGIGSLIVSVITLVGMSLLMTNGRIAVPPVSRLATSGNMAEWTNGNLVFSMIAVASLSSLAVLVTGLSQVTKNLGKLTADMKKERDNLDANVSARTAELNQRTELIETAGHIAREISQISDLDTLLPETVNSVRDRFGFYHAGIFMVDERGEFAVLKAATGEAGRLMLSNKHQLKVGAEGIVGYVTSHGEARIALDVGADAVHFRNPILPDTHSEMALPIIINGNTIGALDVQSKQENAFTLEDARILQSVADQLAVAIDKARLVEELHHSVEELESGMRQYTQRSWRSYLRTARQRKSYRMRQSNLEDNPPTAEEARQAYRTNQMVVRTVTDETTGKSKTIVALPILLRNQVLGTLDIHFDGGNISKDIVPLLETITGRLALAIENTRLLEENQMRADREHLVGDISAKIRSSTDVNHILRTAAAELGRSLGASEVLVALNKPEKDTVS